MPPDPTTSVPPADHRPTTQGDIGHVAPDFDDRGHFNTLVLRPEYRLSIRLGDIDALCPEEASTDAGRQRRLQLLGYFYEPLTSTGLADAFNFAWNWFTTELGKSESDLVTEVKEQIVENGRLPAPGEFAKVWFPGGYCYNQPDFNEALGGPVATPPLQHVKWRRERALWNANNVLGAIPIIAKAERRVDTGWVVAPNVRVYLQLQPPDAPPASHLAPAARATTTFSPAPANPGPAGYVQDHVADPTQNGAHPVDPNDPQADNCHSAVGGKRGLPVAGNIFELKMSDGNDRPGFYAAHSARTLEGRPPFFLPTEQAPADGTSHLNAVRAVTNSEGEAGFIFLPSRTGGDRYKLRAYVGPDSLVSDGTDPQAVSVETGTFVVWRRIRIAKYLVYDYPAGYVQPAAPTGSSSGWTNRQQMDFRVRQMGAINLNTFAAEFQKAYCDVIMESTASRTLLTTAEWRNARDHAIANFAAIRGSAIAGLNIGELFPRANNTPCIFNVLDRTQYNAVRNRGGGSFPRFNSDNAFFTAASRALDTFGEAFMHYFTRNALPFVVVQGPFGDTLTFSGTVPNTFGYLTTSGVASPMRGCYLWWGTPFYNVFSYPGGVSHNTVHEAGHCHYGPHHWTRRGPPLSGGLPVDHDQHDFCVMGYLTVPGDFCGRCLLKLRGWDAAQIPAN